MTKHRAAKHAARAAAQTSGRKYPEARRADVGPADPSRREPPGDYNLPPTNCPECNGQREWTGEGSRAACHFCGASALTLQHAVVYGEGGHVYPGRPADGGNACPRCGSGDTYPGPFVRRCNTCGEAAECEDGAVWTAFEDERGYLYEVPDDDGRIRVRDLDGDTVSWYDPGDEGYDTLIRRMRAETLFEHLVHLHSTEDAAEKSPAEALAYHSWDHDTGVSGEEHEHPHDLVWPMALAPVPEVVWAEDVAGLGLGFTLSGGGYGNPGCDECGMADAVVRIDGTHLCESSLEEASWRTLLDRWRTAHAGERCDECEAVCGDYDGVSFTHEEHCSLHPRNAASGDTNRGGGSRGSSESQHYVAENMAASITIYRLGEDASTGPERVVDLEAGVPTVDGLPDNAAADKLVSEAGWLRSGEWQVTSIGFHTDVVRSTDLHTTTWPDDLEAGPITGLSTERDGLWTAATAGPRGTTTAGGQGTTTEVQT